MEGAARPGGVAGKVKHDILMKPEIKKQTGFFKSNKSKYPMFPFHEEKIKYDDYGEVIRYEDFMDVSESVAQGVDLSSPPPDQEPEDEPETTEVPTKCVSSLQNFKVCKGRHT